MNLNQMRAFQELMLTGSVSQAARNLNRTQPSISAAISGLEDFLGMQLFDRKGGRLHPVPEAQYLFEECHELLQRMQIISQNMKQIKAVESGELRIASMPGPSVFVIPEIISKYQETGANIKTTLVSRSSDAVIQLMGAQQFDIGVADNHLNLKKDSGLFNVEIINFSCLCAVPKDHPLAFEEIITIAHLHQQPLGSLTEEHPVTRQMHSLFQREGLLMNIILSTQYFIPLLTYVEKGLASAIVDPVTAESYRLYKGSEQSDIVFKPFSPTIKFELAIIKPNHRPMSLLAKDFTNRLRDYFHKLAGSEQAEPRIL